MLHSRPALTMYTPTAGHLRVEVEVLVGYAATHELGLRSFDVDVLVQDLRRGVGDGHGLGDGDLVVDVFAGLPVDRLQLILGTDCPVENLLLEAGDGVIGRSHALDLLTGSVRSAGVRHGVTTVSVCDVFKNQRAVIGSGPFLAVLDSGLHCKDVHAVYLKTGDVLATLVVVGKSR